MVELDARKLSVWQRCNRRYAIELKYRYVLWYPTVLFTAVMRRAIVQLSNGAELAKVTQEAVTLFLAQARSPGMEAPQGTDTYKLAMDFCATIKTVLAYLTRITLTALHDVPKKKSPDNSMQWSCLAHQDDTGQLHRWIFVESINDDLVIEEAHKWETFADIVIQQAPMMLHFVAIGRMVNGRRYSPWCRAYKDPLIAGRIRFKKRSGQLAAGWEPLWFADAENDPEKWLDQLLEDEEVEGGLMLHRTIGTPGKVHVQGFYRDLQTITRQVEGMSVEAVKDPLVMPMTRPSCDRPYPCPHQLVCYSTDAGRVFGASGMYEALGKELRNWAGE